jgi:hypothetical protein
MINKVLLFIDKKKILKRLNTYKTIKQHQEGVILIYLSKHI